ncbi:MAG: CocE/NonD family hydrolase [Proteobacteria bacterium]|nr:CocE/NonD family hydrolase [Pseudomonadota bacterium]MBI3498205.1 CocE/NonD family hydrolase [Pseudomonadota bacterium]
MSPVVVAHDVMMKMRDGVRLAADLYRPATPAGEPVEGRLPTILTRTSYDKANPVMQVEPVGMFFARHGYAVVIQDLRGRGHSEGVGDYHHRANPKEGPDGYDTIEWIAAQAWSDGKIGMVGSSHSGCVQNVAAIHRPPHLEALWVDAAPITGNGWESRQGGAMRLHMVPALFVHAHDAPEIRDDPAARKRIEDGAMNIRRLIETMPFKVGHTPLTAVPNLERVLMRYQENGVSDAWWTQEVMDQKSRLERYADVPTVFSTGWYDCFVAEVTDQFRRLARQNKSKLRLVVGPWNHTAMRSGSSVVGEVEFGKAASWGYRVYNAERLRWFDRWLKGRKNGVDGEAAVRLFIMGGGRGAKTARGHLHHGGAWRQEKTWPPKRAVPTQFYLRAGGALTTEAPSEKASSLTWTHDPSHPVPTVGAAIAPFFEWMPVPSGMDGAYLPPRARMRSVVPDGPMHQRERQDLIGCRAPYPLMSERHDVIVFQSEPLARAIEVTGPIHVHLFVASSAPDTDFTAKLLDVYPPSPDYPEGFHMNLADSILRMRFRSGLEREEMMKPGRVYEISIELPPIANLFEAGHRLRLDIASSNFPHFDVNPNTGEPLGRHTKLTRAQNTLHLGARRPSYVLLSIMPRR